jgi:pimeloyl-ACP methyl ester carboxylesterase
VPITHANGVDLYYEVTGSGEPLVLVHGSWADHHHWDPVIPQLSESFQVVAYDRRGHSRSARPPGQGSVHEDADDLAALIEATTGGPPHVVANSFGAIVAMHAAIRRPDVFATLVAHEPPLLQTLAGTRFEPALSQASQRVSQVIERLQTGDDEGGAKLFIDTVARAPGAWENDLTDDARTLFTNNAPTFLDERRDPDAQQVDLDQLAQFDRPALLTKGTASPAFLAAVVDELAAALPNFATETVEGADHAPHQTTPQQYVDVLTRFIHAAPTSA